MEKPKSKALNLLLSIFFTAVVFCLAVYFIFFYTPRKASALENRNLQQFPAVSADSVKLGTYQKDFEKAIADQSFFRDLMITLNSRKDQLISKLSYFVFQKQAVQGKILNVYKDVALYELSGRQYLLQLPFIYDDKLNSKLEAAAEKFGDAKAALPDKNFIVYDIEPAFISAVNPLNPLYPDAVSGRYSNTLHSSLPKSVTSLSMRYNDLPSLLSDFYITDHHFNGYAAEKVYKNIYTELSKNAALSPELKLTVEEVPNSMMMGSKARSALYDKISEPLTEAAAQLPAYKVYINGELKARARPERVRSGQLRADADASPDDTRFISVYAEYFGYDFAEVVYQNETAGNNRKLLIVGPSYTQTFEQLLAAHYSATYVIDPRYYNDQFKSDFDLIAYAKEKGVDDIVYFAQPQQLADDAWLIR